MFFNRRSFRGHSVGLFARAWMRALELLVGRDGLTHVVAQIGPRVYTYDRKHGCMVSMWPFDLSFPIPPVLGYDLWVDEPDLTPWEEGWAQPSVVTLLDVLHLLPRGIRAINCVQVTARLLCIEERLRTPTDLARALEELCSCSTSH